MSEFKTIRDTPLGECIGAIILDITADDPEDLIKNRKSRIYLHLSNGETIFATLGEEMVGMLGTEDEEEI